MEIYPSETDVLFVIQSNLYKEFDCGLDGNYLTIIPKEKFTYRINLTNLTCSGLKPAHEYTISTTECDLNELNKTFSTSKFLIPVSYCLFKYFRNLITFKT